MFDLFNFFKTESKMENGGAAGVMEKPLSMLEQIQKVIPPKKGFWSDGDDNPSADEHGYTLGKEDEYFKTVQNKLKEKYGTGVAVIKNRSLIGVYPDRSTALKEGVNIIGYQSMLVRDINEEDRVVRLKYC